MTPKELSELKQGDVVRHEQSGAQYIVLSNRTGVPTVVRNIELHNSPKWTHVYTLTPVVVPAPPSIVDKVTELVKRGWTFEDDPKHRWGTPDGYFYYSLEAAFNSRGCHPTKSDLEAKKQLPTRNDRAKSFSEARIALRAAGWENVSDGIWRSPEGHLYGGTKAAYQAYTKPSEDGTCNAS